MNFIHHTRSRHEWRARYEQYLIALTEGRLNALRYFQLSAEMYDICFDELPESAARQTLLPPEDDIHAEAIAASAAILYLGKFRLPYQKV